MTQTCRDNIKALGDALSTLALVFGGGWAVWQYIRNSKREHTRAVFEARKPFDSKVLELYLQASDDAAVIATTHDSAEREAAIAHFRRLYCGMLAVAESRDVADAMIKFNERLSGACTQKDSLDLAKVLRNSIARTWPLEPLELRALENQTEAAINPKEALTKKQS
jgi:hypothetical protein